MNQNEVARQERDPRREDAALLPAVDVIEDANGITLFADLPGVPKDKLAVRVEGNTLTIEGEIALLTTKGIEATHAEVQLPRYRRSFTVGSEFNSEKVGAELRQGVLKLHIPKAEHAKPPKIEVKIA